MKLNMSILDRVIRLITGLVIGFLYFTGLISGTAGLIVLIIGIVFFLTSLVGFCPLYSLLRISTCDNKRD